jgi:predicted TIM-barrel fold metal-dependent hydrolase
MAILPIQDPNAAAEELRRAVEDLGMSGGMLASNGEGVRAHLGDRTYWPIYAAAEQLKCALAVHGGSHHRLASIDTYQTYYGAHALGHPLTVMIQCVGMLSHGVFDQFPGVRVAFLEGGAAWVPFVMDRLDRSYSSHFQDDREGNPVLGSPRPGEKASQYFKRHITEGRIFIGFDTDDESLGYAVQRAGTEPFLYATDFPHENTTAQTCRHEIDELLERADLTNPAKEALLATNAMRFYGRDA